MGSSPDAEHTYGQEAEPRHGMAGPSLAPANALRWWQVFNGDPRELRRIRQWLVSLLPDYPARRDVISVATELGSNALLHTVSGRGGVFAVEIMFYHPIVRVAVADRGGPAEPQVVEDPDGEHGRGLLLVRGLSMRTGVEGDYRGRTVWAEIAWDGPDAATADAEEAAIREGQEALARCFPGVLTWFGRSTQAWWALSDTDNLVAAPTPADLAKLLYRIQERRLHDLVQHRAELAQAGLEQRQQGSCTAR